MRVKRRAKTSHNTRPPRTRLPYKTRHSLLSRGEAAFHRALRTAVQGKYLVAFKVRLADLITCGPTAWNDGFGYLIATHHLDFVLCDHRSARILLAIELDDRSHDKPKRKRRDTFINDALSAAGIPLLRIQAAAKYDPDRVRQEIEHHLAAPGKHRKP